MESTWESRDLPVLDAAVRYLDEHAGHSYPQGYDLAEMTGLSNEEVTRALLALEDQYVRLHKTMGDPSHWSVMAVYPEARTVVGQWPTPEALADRLVQAMEHAAEKEPDEEKRGKLRSLGSWAGSAGRDLMVDVAAAALNRGMFGG